MAKRQLASKRYYRKMRGIEEPNDEELKQKEVTKAINQLLAYEKQKERQRQQRHERGLKPKGRPFKSLESQANAINLLNQINEFEQMINQLD